MFGILYSCGWNVAVSFDGHVFAVRSIVPALEPMALNVFSCPPFPHTATNSLTHPCIHPSILMYLCVYMCVCVRVCACVCRYACMSGIMSHFHCRSLPVFLLDNVYAGLASDRQILSAYTYIHSLTYTNWHTGNEKLRQMQIDRQTVRKLIQVVTLNTLFMV